MKKVLFLALCVGFMIPAMAQIQPNRHRVVFTDKIGTPYTISNPSAFLTARSIQRRNQAGVVVTAQDLPITPAYLDSINSTGVKILARSKWMNSVVIKTTDAVALAKIASFPFVTSVTLVGQSQKKSPGDVIFEVSNQKENAPVFKKNGKSYDYGQAYTQINMIGGDILHDQGFRGQGKVIAVLDAGFQAANTIDALDSLFNENRVLGTHDFVKDSSFVFAYSTHGTCVLSIMAANYPTLMIGTAPKASYWLLRTEDAANEYVVEEDFWVAGAEFADSVGADIINSSLGYTVFDDISQNHTYAMMDGNTNLVTRGADLAASKGILVVLSAGNEGDGAWHYVGAPGDADSALTIGSVGLAGAYSYFSSTGPSYDKRIKPDVVAVGEGTTFADSFNNISSGNGTSFSSPVIAGMTACLWQANPTMTAQQIALAIRKSASQYSHPDSLLGYGIPNFGMASIILSGLELDHFSENSLINAFPNPFSDQLNVLFFSSDTQTVVIELLDQSGKRVSVAEKYFKPNGYYSITMPDIAKLSSGVYILKITSDKKKYTRKLVKQ
ncbi:MAG: S8 family serine peptidase [Bacteroidota bacterium]